MVIITMKLNKIIITGTTGFIGSFLLKFFLERNFFVVDIVRKKNKELLKLKKKYKKNYFTIKPNEIKKLKNKKFNFFIHTATFYKSSYKKTEINELLESNIFFPINVLKQIYHKKLRLINFGSMMEYNKNFRDPKNAYAASKVLFEEITKIFFFEKFYHIKIFETYDIRDIRPKILPTMLYSMKNNKQFKLNNKNLELNFISRDNIASFLYRIITDNIASGTYVLKNRNNTNIHKLFLKLNSLKKNKIKIKFKKNIKKIKPKIKSINFNNKLFNIIKNEIR